jgi:recombination protein RecT
MSTNALKAAATGTNAVTTQKTGLPALLDKMKPQLLAALPKHMNPDRMVRIVLTEMRKTPALGKCSEQSLMAAVVIASQLGLEPGINGQAYLIPYGDTCTFVPGWKGLVDLAQRSGRASVWTGAVFDGDEFDFEYGTSPYIKHKPGPNSGNPKALTHVYAVGRVRNAEFPVLEVWPVAQVTAHRDRFNKVGTRHYSFQHFEKYGRKVALLQVLKYMPQSIELATAIDLEHAAEGGKQKLDLNDAIDGTFVPAAGGDDGQGDAGGEQQQRTPIDEPTAVERFRGAKTEAEIDTIWHDVCASYAGQTPPLPIEAARNTFRDEIKRKAAGGK